jgi:hypothetical protein
MTTLVLSNNMMFGVDFEGNLKQKIGVSYDDEIKKTSYKININDKCFCFEIHDENTINKGVMGFYSHHGLTLDEQLGIIDNLLNYINENNDFKRINTLDWGKITETDVLTKLISTAMKSENWDLYLAQKKYNKNDIVLSLLIKSGAFKKLKDIFNSYNLKLSESTVEGVTIGKVSNLTWMPFMNELLKQGILDENDIIPYGMILTFKVEKL